MRIRWVAEYGYWDRETKQETVFIVNARGVYQRGTVSVQGNVITVEGRISFPDAVFDYRNTFEVRPDGTVVDRWFQTAFGDWRPGHVVELHARGRGRTGRGTASCGERKDRPRASGHGPQA